MLFCLLVVLSSGTLAGYFSFSFDLCLSFRVAICFLPLVIRVGVVCFSFIRLPVLNYIDSYGHAERSVSEDSASYRLATIANIANILKYHRSFWIISIIPKYFDHKVMDIFQMARRKKAASG